MTSSSLQPATILPVLQPMPVNIVPLNADHLEPPLTATTLKRPRVQEICQASDTVVYARPPTLPELYGHHHDDETRISALPIVTKHSGWEACDLAELAYFGGALLSDQGAWTGRAAAIITQMECKMRGLDSQYSHEELILSASNCGLLRERVKHALGLHALDPCSDLDLVLECRRVIGY